MGQLRHGSVVDGDLPDVRLGGLTLPALVAIGAEQDEAPVGGERQRAAVVEVAEGQLARRAAVGADDPDMVVAWLQIALVVGAEGDLVDDP